MTSKKKTNLKIIGATAVGLFSLTSLFTGTFAWFSMNQSVAATGMSVTVAKMSNVNILSCYAVRYDGNYGAIAYDISDGNHSVAMSEYDFIFKDRNVNTPLFIRMEITGFDATKNLTINIPCTGSYKTDNKVDPYLSNVVSAQLLSGIKDSNNQIVKDTNTWVDSTGNGVHTQAVVNSYKGMLAHAKDGTGTPFVVNSSKNNTIPLTLSAASVFNQSLITQRDDGNGNTIDVAIAYVVFDYYVVGNINLVKEYHDSYNGADHAPTFTSDISTMVLGNEGNS